MNKMFQTEKRNNKIILDTACQRLSANLAGWLNIWVSKVTGWENKSAGSWLVDWLGKLVSWKLAGWLAGKITQLEAARLAGWLGGKIN